MKMEYGVWNMKYGIWNIVSVLGLNACLCPLVCTQRRCISTVYMECSITLSLDDLCIVCLSFSSMTIPGSRGTSVEFLYILV